MGINDTKALAQAAIGTPLETANDVVIEIARINLVKIDLHNIIKAKK